MVLQHDRSNDYRRHESDFCRALLHARALQRAADLGNCGVGFILAGDYVCAHVQRLLDTQLDSQCVLALLAWL